MIIRSMGSPWKAVADDSRREMLVLLKDNERTPSEISNHFSFTQPAISTHLRVLKEAGLVLERREGKNRFYSLNRQTMSDLSEFFDSFWDDKLDRLREHVEKRQSREELE